MKEQVKEMEEKDGIQEDINFFKEQRDKTDNEQLKKIFDDFVKMAEDTAEY